MGLDFIKVYGLGYKSRQNHKNGSKIEQKLPKIIENPFSTGSPLGIGSKIGFLADFGHFPYYPRGKVKIDLRGL
jgi:hypothetical protein